MRLHLLVVSARASQEHFLKRRMPQTISLPVSVSRIGPDSPERREVKQKLKDIAAWKPTVLP